MRNIAVTVAPSYQKLIHKVGNMSTIEELQQQVIDLQSRLAYQEDMIHSLDKTIVKQDQAIALLKLQLNRWESKLEAISYSIESSSGDHQEPPPHY